MLTRSRMTERQADWLLSLARTRGYGGDRLPLAIERSLRDDLDSRIADIERQLEETRSERENFNAPSWPNLTGYQASRAIDWLLDVEAQLKYGPPPYVEDPIEPPDIECPYCAAPAKGHCRSVGREPVSRVK